MEGRDLMLGAEQAKAMTDVWRHGTQKVWETWFDAFRPLLPDPAPLSELFDASVAAWQAAGRNVAGPGAVPGPGAFKTFVEQLGRALSPLDAVRGREFGTLAASFNRMASELRVREAALQEAHARILQSEKLAAVGQLGAGIAHEVKNPLAGILGCAQLSLRKAERGTPLEKNLLLIEKETKRCRTIIDNLLRFARQEKTVLEPIEVNRVVEDAIAIVSHQLELQQVKIRKQLALDLPMVRGHADQLQQVLMNLMINAQDAMEGSPGTVTITTALSDADRIEVRVTDTGPGIPKEIQGKLFEPFFTTKPRGKGTGLGLAVTYGIVKDHGGEIRLHSEPGHGATFIITLPLVRSDEDPKTASSGAGPQGPEADPAAKTA